MAPHMAHWPGLGGAMSGLNSGTSAAFMMTGGDFDETPVELVDVAVLAKIDSPDNIGKYFSDWNSSALRFAYDGLGELGPEYLCQTIEYLEQLIPLSRVSVHSTSVGLVG